MEFSDEDTLTGKGGGVFGYLAPVFDTEDADGTYHRLVLDGDFKGCKYEVIAAACNEDLTEELQREGMTFQQQKAILTGRRHIRKANTRDILLHELSGRYLYLAIGVAGSMAESTFDIRGFCMEFPRSSFAEYLPEVYQNQPGSFFERYLAAFQSLYEELEQKLDEIPAKLDYELTDPENLKLFTGWTGAESGEYEMNTLRRRYILKNLQKFQSGKGTKEVLCRVLELMTERKVRVLEYFKWHDWMENSTLLSRYEELYGMDADTFSVFLDCVEEASEDLPSRGMLYRLMEEYTPLGMKCRLILLTKSSSLDRCYLDVNGRLAVPSLADTRGLVLGGSQVLG